MLFIYHTHILWFRLESHWCVECRCQLPVSKLCWHIKWGSMQQYRPWSRSTEIFRSAWGLFGNETKPQHCIRPIDQCNSISMIHENANSFLVLCHDDNTKDVWIWEVIIDEECAYTHTVSSPFMECIQSVSAFSLSGVNDILPEHADIANLINIPNEDSTVMLLRLEVGKIWICIPKFNLWLRKLISLKHNFRLCFLRSTSWGWVSNWHHRKDNLMYRTKIPKVSYEYCFRYSHSHKSGTSHTYLYPFCRYNIDVSITKPPEMASRDTS